MDTNSDLWKFLCAEQKDLIKDSECLLDQAKSSSRILTDYSYIVFPVSKTYEGFLKKLFLDLGIINEDQYKSDHFRIGKALNPYIEPHLKTESYFDRISDKLGIDLALELWEQWRKGRNLLFHYFPSHLRCLRLIEAEDINSGMLKMMDKTVKYLKQ